MADYAKLAVDVLDAPDWVVAAAVAATQDIVAALEVMRDSRTVDPDQAATLAAMLSNVYAEIPASITRLGVDMAFVDDLFAAARAIGAAMAPEDAAAAFASEVDSFPAAVAAAGVSSNSARVAANAVRVNALGRLVMISGLVDSLVRQTWSDRPAATAARAMALALLDAELEVASAIRATDLYAAIGDARAALQRFFAATVADLRPVVIVTAPRALPAVWHAWRLYADPTRAQELIDRNRAPHPAFLSERFEAVAP